MAQLQIISHYHKFHLDRALSRQGIGWAEPSVPFLIFAHNVGI
jgi:hypothetical protein